MGPSLLFALGTLLTFMIGRLKEKGMIDLGFGYSNNEILRRMYVTKGNNMALGSLRCVAV